jgi:hypothetical protein
MRNEIRDDIGSPEFTSIGTRKRTRPEKRRAFTICVCLSLTGILTACDSGNYQANPVPPVDIIVPPPPPGPSFATDAHGHYRGDVTIGEETYIAEGLLTVDGITRIAIWGPADSVIVRSGGDLPVDEMISVDSSQFIGRIETTDGDRGYGSGVVIGQHCQPPDPGRFCAEPAATEIELTALHAGYGVNLVGEIRVTTNEGIETWVLGIGHHSIYYESSIRPRDPYDKYKETLAAFAQADDVVITIDDAREVFFQGPASGCIGNGTMAPHLDGSYYVFDVTLVIENCNAQFDDLNASYSGLASETQSGSWDYDFNLVVFLSTPAGMAPAAAVSMYAVPIL